MSNEDITYEYFGTSYSVDDDFEINWEGTGIPGRISYYMTDKNLNFKYCYSIESIPNPSFMAMNKSGDTWFACSETTTGGKVGVYSFFPWEGNRPAFIEEKDTIDVDVKQICHISYSNKHGVLLGAAYSSGDVFTIGLNGDKFTSVLSQLNNNSCDDSRAAHAHWIVPDISENFAACADLGHDRIYVYKFIDGKLCRNDEFPYLELKKGDGPRSIAFSRTNDLLYVVTEFSSMLLTLSYDPLTGELRELDRRSILPDGFSGAATGSGLIVTYNNKFIYTSCMGADSIALFELDESGRILRKKADLSCFGKGPRFINITYNGIIFMLANQITNTFVVIEADPDTGLYTGRYGLTPAVGANFFL